MNDYISFEKLVNKISSGLFWKMQGREIKRLEDKMV